MSFDADPNESITISASDFEQMCDEIKKLDKCITIEEAKEREAKLITSAYKDGYKDGYSDGDYPYDDSSNLDIGAVYEGVDLKELK